MSLPWQIFLGAFSAGRCCTRLSRQASRSSLSFFFLAWRYGQTLSRPATIHHTASRSTMPHQAQGKSHTLPITGNFLQASPSLDHIMPLKVSLLLLMGEFIGKVEHTYS